MAQEVGRALSRDTVVTLNIGGQLYTTTVGTLCGPPSNNNFFTALSRGRFSPTKPRK